jgi:signal transduction histidine kinase
MPANPLTYSNPRIFDSLAFLSRMFPKRPVGFFFNKGVEGPQGKSNMGPFRAIIPYCISVALVAATVAIRMVLDTWLDDHHPYTFFFAAITLTAWFAGFWPSILAIVLSYFAGDWFFAAPRFAFDFQDFAKGDLAGLGGFLFAGLAIAFTSRALHAARDRAEAKKQTLAREIEERKRIQHELEITQMQLSEHAENLEHKVLERTKTLEQSLKSLEGVLYHVAHDLRAPLRGMSGLTAILLENYASHFDQIGREYAQQIMDSAGHMDALIKDLLAYGRLGHMDVALEKVDVERPLAATLNLLATEISARHAQIDIHRPLASVMGNESLLRQILLNFVSNALIYVSRGTVPHVRIWTESDGNNVRICVRDNGIGIAAEYHQQIFNVFERLHRTEEYPGTGIGLAIVAKGAERIGGRAGVESELNKGSTFWIELPPAKGRP